jgi:hypothetical protein
VLASHCLYSEKCRSALGWPARNADFAAAAGYDLGDRAEAGKPPRPPLDCEGVSRKGVTRAGAACDRLAPGAGAQSAVSSGPPARRLCRSENGSKLLLNVLKAGTNCGDLELFAEALSLRRLNQSEPGGHIHLDHLVITILTSCIAFAQ